MQFLAPRFGQRSSFSKKNIYFVANCILVVFTCHWKILTLWLLYVPRDNVLKYMISLEISLTFCLYTEYIYSRLAWNISNFTFGNLVVCAAIIRKKQKSLLSPLYWCIWKALQCRQAINKWRRYLIYEEERWRYGQYLFNSIQNV